ncbi:TlpA disulfide reductase family protein [Solitalea koreensis]|uniref:Thiol-disulfide isomerase or thioredoxin n=1 Tax=Solitalea koreensis TaxID=543615 RepID=A0A521AVF6_9SPHI|nr:TlpA disulfide reductase family protein [Solitalea koreensis]SMO38832.1 Thiol-disulfide isomerase or thioredoxin [Solitalea koreensis]
MKKLIVYAAVLCGLGSSLPVLAEEGVKTVVKGEMLVSNGRATLFKKDFSPNPKSTAQIINGRFSMETKLTQPSYIILTTSDPIVKGFDLFLTPGDDISVAVRDKNVVLSGKGSKLNQFLFDLTRKYDYANNQFTAKEVYTNRINAINASTNEEVKINKAALLGYAQGEYLDKVFTSYMESKVAGETDEINKVKFDDLNISLAPEIVSYYNWYKTINEIMYAKMEAGKLKVRNSNTWIADFAKTIENQKLREAYIVALLDFARLEEDVFKIKDYAREALPLVKDPVNIAKINANIIGADKVTRYNNAVPGTDFSAYTFQKPDGSIAKISDYKGKIVLIDIWSTWCHPCVAEMPFLKQLEHEMEGKDVVFLSLNGDVKEEYWQNFMKKRNLTGNQVKMTAGLKDDPFFNQIGRTGIPRFVLIDKEGKMVNAKCCQRPSNPVLKVYLNELLSK